MSDSELRAIHIVLEHITEKLIEIDKTLLWFRIERDTGLKRIADLEKIQDHLIDEYRVLEKKIENIFDQLADIKGIIKK